MFETATVYVMRDLAKQLPSYGIFTQIKDITTTLLNPLHMPGVSAKKFVLLQQGILVNT